MPITVHTWPAARNACTRHTGAVMIASIAGGTRTWLTSRLKLSMPSRFASCTVIALGGAVVSKPIPKNTTCLSGLARAMASASIGL